MARIRGWTKDIEHKRLIQWTTTLRTKPRPSGRVYGIVEIYPQTKEVLVKRAVLTSDRKYRVILRRTFRTLEQAKRFAVRYMRTHPKG
ncbi:MAG: hypothetical protein DRJ64_09285 [Thermoprotei archaeon]|nr:MAG: hypothetical protein DRJ64_09285 [Thermoprotei archaeon]